MNIRLEQPKDYREVENLTREAFWNIYRPGCTEHYVLNQYRTNPDFIPELDLVMEEDNMIIGHVMFSKAELVLDNGNRKPSWTFGPISIHPDYQRKGYGLKLLQYALERARMMGIDVSERTSGERFPCTCRKSNPAFSIIFTCSGVGETVTAVFLIPEGTAVRIFSACSTDTDLLLFEKNSTMPMKSTSAGLRCFTSSGVLKPQILIFVLIHTTSI